MKTKVRIKKLTDRQVREARGKWDRQYIEDCVRNAGKVVTLYNYRVEHDCICWELRTEDGVDWHNSGIWTGNDELEEFNKVFMIVPDIKPVKLPEDLFTL